MNKTLKATDAARSFSEILNSVKYKGDRYTIVRGGKPAAAIVPVEATGPARRLSELQAILKALPGLEDDNESFGHDIEALIRLQPAAPEEQSWG